METVLGGVAPQVQKTSHLGRDLASLPASSWPRTCLEGGQQYWGPSLSLSWTAPLPHTTREVEAAVLLCAVAADRPRRSMAVSLGCQAQLSVSAVSLLCLTL